MPAFINSHWHLMSSDQPVPAGVEAAGGGGPPAAPTGGGEPPAEGGGELTGPAGGTGGGTPAPAGGGDPPPGGGDTPAAAAGASALGSGGGAPSMAPARTDPNHCACLDGSILFATRKCSTRVLRNTIKGSLINAQRCCWCSALHSRNQQGGTQEFEQRSIPLQPCAQQSAKHDNFTSALQSKCMNEGCGSSRVG